MPAGSQETSSAGEWKAGWPAVLAAAAGMALSSVGVYATGVFIAPIEADLGWSRAEISSGLTILACSGAIFAPFVGAAVDRFGSRRIAIVGVVGYCAMLAALSLTGAALWQWWLLWFGLSVAGLGAKPTVWAAAVSSLFSAGRGLALSVMLCGTGIGSSLTPLLSNYLIDLYGWRTALVGLGAFWAVLVLPLVVLFFSSAKDRARIRARREPLAAAIHALPLPGVSVREGLVSLRFAKLAIAAFLTSLTVVSFVVNLVPILSASGIARGTAAQIAGMLGISTIVGRLTGGYLIDRINGNLVAAVSIAMPLVTCALLLAAPGSVPVAIAGALVLGLSLGAELDAVAYLTTRHFGMRNFGVMFGTISALLAASTGLGPLFVSHVYDVTHSYHMVLVIYVPMCVIASLLFLTLGRYPVFEARTAA